MKLLASVAVLAALGLLGVASAAESVHNAFYVGAHLVPEVQIESVPGRVLKTEFIDAVTKFLALLDEEIERMYLWAVRELEQEATGISHQIEDKVLSLPSNAGPSEFDFELTHLTPIYREVVELVLNTRLRVASALHALPEDDAPHDYTASLRKVLRERLWLGLQPEAGHRAIYSLKELFTSLYTSVIGPDMALLHDWVDRTLKEGEKAVQAAALTIQHQKRDAHLQKLLADIRAIAANLQRHDAVISAHTSPNYWSDYVYERDRLFHV